MEEPMWRYTTGLWQRSNCVALNRCTDLIGILATHLLYHPNDTSNFHGVTCFLFHSIVVPGVDTELVAFKDNVVISFTLEKLMPCALLVHRQLRDQEKKKKIGQYTFLRVRL